MGFSRMPDILKITIPHKPKQKHYNIPVFIPHQGCGNECVFCSQHKITGQKKPPVPAEIFSIIERELGHVNRVGYEKIEIAFFGGSFTGIEHDLMLGYLKTANKFIKSGRANGIRLSTRADYIDAEILEILKNLGVSSIELGIQSMNDSVLERTARGHKAADIVRACGLILEYGFSLTGQMMLGLPGSSAEIDFESAASIVGMGVHAARIYPTVVFPGTKLDEWHKGGFYEPLSLDEAVKHGAAARRCFDEHGVDVIRTGLYADDGVLAAGDFIGPYHPAFGELVEGRVVFELLCARIEEYAAEHGSMPKALEVYADKRNMSKVAGHKKANLAGIMERYGVEVRLVSR